jgi:hypothetical protein
MRQVFRGVVPTLLLFALSGCGSNASWVASDPVVLSPKPATYEMPVSQSEPKRAHRILGKVSVSLTIKPSFKEESTYDQAVEQLKKEARKRGADAVVSVRTIDSQHGGQRARLTLVGTLVIFTGPEPMAKAG